MVNGPTGLPAALWKTRFQIVLRSPNGDQTAGKNPTSAIARPAGTFAAENLNKKSEYEFHPFIHARSGNAGQRSPPRLDPGGRQPVAGRGAIRRTHPVRPHHRCAVRRADP